MELMLWFLFNISQLKQPLLFRDNLIESDFLHMEVVEGWEFANASRVPMEQDSQRPLKRETSAFKRLKPVSRVEEEGEGASETVFMN